MNSPRFHHHSLTPLFIFVWTFASAGILFGQGPGTFTTLTASGLLSVTSPDGAVFTSATSNGAQAPSGAGIRLVWNPRKAAFRSGYVGGNEWDDTNIGYYSFAAGQGTRASSSSATAFGYYAEAAGYGSTFATGYYTHATGYVAHVGGYMNIASGNYSTAYGFNTQAIGSVGTALGSYTIARAFASTVVGQYNVDNPAYSTGAWVATDPLFVIGNGTSSSAPSNAFTVYKNGDIKMQKAQGDISMGIFQ